MKRLSALAFGAAILATACVVEVEYDPLGSDFAMEGAWTVAGLPPTMESCGEITTVRVVLYDAGTPFGYDELTFPCAQGSFVTEAIFRAGEYETEWQALDPSDVIIGRGARQNFDVAVGTPSVTLQTTNWE